MSLSSQRLREFSEIGRLPAPGNDVAIATQRLDAILEGDPSSWKENLLGFVLASLHPEALRPGQRRVPAHPGASGRLDGGDVA